MTGDDAPRVGGILLAAGGSSRMGRPKQLVEFEGDTLLRRTASSMAGSACRPQLVVLGADAELCRSELTGLKVGSCINDDWASGMSSSIKTGFSCVTEIDPLIDAIIILLCDQPYITTEIIDNFIAEYRRIRPLAIASEYNGVIGVPALFSRDMFDQIMKLKGDRGARELIIAAGEKVKRVSLPEAAFEVDSPSDLTSLENLR